MTPYRAQVAGLCPLAPPPPLWWAGSAARALRHRRGGKHGGAVEATLAVCHVSVTSMARWRLLDLTFAEFPTERAVKPLTAVLPAHGWTHGGAAPTTSHNALWLFAYWQGHLNTDTHIRVHLFSPLNDRVKTG